MKRRNLVALLVLSIVTLGIYVLFWLYMTRKELLSGAANHKGIPSFLWLLAPLVGGLVGLLAALGSDNIPALQAFSMALALLTILGAIGIPLWWFYRYFTITHEVTGGTEGMLLYVIWFLCIFIAFFPVWMLLVQNDINKYLLRQANVSAPPIVPAGGSGPVLS